MAETLLESNKTESPLNPNIPESAFPITKEFIEDILGNKISWFKASIGTNPGDNYLSVIFSIQVRLQLQSETENNNRDRDTVNEKNEIIPNPTTTVYLLAKTYPLNEESQLAVNEMNAFWKEVNLYREFIPDLLRFQEKILGFERDGDIILKLAHPPFIAGSAINYLKVKEMGDEDEDDIEIPMNLNNYLVMTDIKKTNGFEMLDKRLGLDIYHTSLVINELAKIHAVSWAYKEKENLPSLACKYPYLLGSLYTQKGTVNLLNTNFALVSEMLKQYPRLVDRISTGLEKVAEIGPEEIMLAFMPPEGLIDENKVAQYMKDWRREEDSLFSEDLWAVACHGDAWINNMLFKYANSESDADADAGPLTKKPTEVILVDLQLYREGCPTTDLAFFLYTSTTAEFRTENLGPLLEMYAQKFMEYCERLHVEPMKGFTLDNLLQRFRRAKMYGFMVACFYLPIILTTPQDAVHLGSAEAFLNTESGKSIADRMIAIAKELVEDNVF